jgi:hypothetical protein
MESFFNLDDWSFYLLIGIGILIFFVILYQLRPISKNIAEGLMEGNDYGYEEGFDDEDEEGFETNDYDDNE